MLGIGDIAVRIQQRNEIVVGSCSYFEEGYFLVISIFKCEGPDEVIHICKIMNECGETSWILDKKLQVVFKT